MVIIEKVVVDVSLFIVFGSLFLIMLVCLADVWLDGLLSEKVKRWLA